jgi:transposase
MAKKVEVKVQEQAPIELVIQNPCSRCGAETVITGGGRSGKDYHCNKCGANETR